MTTPPTPTNSAAATAGSTLRPDLVAGLTAAAVILPKSMAYATVAGLPVAVGLYTSLVPLVIYALLGTSRVLSVTTTTTIAILVGTELASAVPDGDPARLLLASVTLSALVGIVLLLAAALRFGFVANFISLPVLTGFKAGIGLVIVLDQIPKLLGVHIDKAGFIQDLISLVQQLPQTSLPTLAVALATIVLLFGIERLWPRLPAPLLVVGSVIAASFVFELQNKGVSIVGTIPQGLPRLTLPDQSLLGELAPAALGIALMSFTETIAAGRAFVACGDPEIKPNRELVALGAANLGGALTGAMAAGGGTSQTAVVRAAGGKTQKASLVTAAAAAATMLVLAPLLGYLPNATLAAVVIVYSVGLIQPREFAAIRKVRVMEFSWACVAGLGVLIFGTLKGIIVAIIVSLLGLAFQTALPPVYMIGRKRDADYLRPVSDRHPEDETFGGLLVLRPEGSIYFMNAPHVATQIRNWAAEKHPDVIALDLSRVPDIEYSALEMLREGERHAIEHGATLWLVGLNPSVLAVVRKSGFAEQLGPERLLYNARTAIDRYQQLKASGVSLVPEAAPPSQTG